MRSFRESEMSRRETRLLVQGQVEEIVITTRGTQEKAIADRCGVREKIKSLLPTLTAKEVIGRVRNRIKEETIIESLENVNLEILHLKEDQDLEVLEIPHQKETQDPELTEILHLKETLEPEVTEVLLPKGSLVHLNQIIKPIGVAKVRVDDLLMHEVKIALVNLLESRTEIIIHERIISKKMATNEVVPIRESQTEKAAVVRMCLRYAVAQKIKSST